MCETATAQKIQAIVETLPEEQAQELLKLAESLHERGLAVTVPSRTVDLSVFRALRGSYDGSPIRREELYDRASLR